MQLDYDFGTILRWCADNGLSFRIVKTGELLSLQSQVGNVSADYVIDEPLTPDNLGRAIYASLFATKTGAEFHQKHGYFPPVSKQPEINPKDAIQSKLTLPNTEE